MKHYNPTISNTLTKRFALKGESTDQVDEVISPVYEIKPVIDFVKTVARTTTGTSTLAATPANNDLYVTGISVSYSADVNANITQCEVYANVAGVATTLAKLAHALGAAGGQSIYITFDHPIKLDRGVNVSFALVSAVGTFSGVAVLYGYQMLTYAGSN